MGELTTRQRRAVLLMHAYLAHHARAAYRGGAWLYLLAWAELGGTSADVPPQFGGQA